MNNQVPKYVTQARASYLLGIPEVELSRISKESGLGLVERAGDEEETYFTYEELQRICLLAAHQMQSSKSPSGALWRARQGKRILRDVSKGQFEWRNAIAGSKQVEDSLVFPTPN